jgi:hypothetical protein
MFPFDSSGALLVERRPFARWDDAWWITRAGLEIVFVPALARIARFARRPQVANALWFFADAAEYPVESWANAGGEKLWFWPQHDWKNRMGRAWPPPELRASDVRAEPWGLSYSLPPYADFGLSIRREIRVLGGEAACFQLLTRIEARGAGATSPWSVTQIPKPASLQVAASAAPSWRAMRAPPGAPTPQPRPEGGWAVVCPAAPAFKLGFAADTLQAPTPAGLLTISALSLPGAWAGAVDDAAVRAQVFSTTSDAPCLPPGTEPYVELEFVAPPEASEWVLDWRLE